jgi:hypothetical protein
MNFIINKEEYLSAMAAWNKIANRDATDHIFYNALRGHDLKRGFAPTTSDRKLANGKGEWEGYTSALSNAHWRIRAEPTYAHDNPDRIARREAAVKERMEEWSKRFGTEFTPELLTALRELLK